MQPRAAWASRDHTNGLGPAERLLRALALADRMTRMARRASVDRRGRIGCVLRDVRRHIEVAETLDELAGVIEVSARIVE